MSAISNNIKNLRKKEKLTQKEFAEKVGVHFTTISKIEKGIREPSLTLIDKIRCTFNVSFEELMINNYDSINVQLSTSPYLFDSNMNKLIQIMFTLVEQHTTNESRYSDLIKNDPWTLFMLFEKILKFQIKLYESNDYSFVKEGMSSLLFRINITMLDIDLEHLKKLFESKPTPELKSKIKELEHLKLDVLSNKNK